MLTVATAVKPNEDIRAAALRIPGAEQVVFRTTTDWDINRRTLRKVQAPGPTTGLQQSSVPQIHCGVPPMK